MEKFTSINYSNTIIYFIRTTIEKSLDATFILGLVLNVILFFLCIRIKNKEFGPYKRIIMLAVVSDIIFIFISFGGEAPDIVPLLISLSAVFIFMFSECNNLIIFYFRYSILIQQKILSLTKFCLLILINLLWNVVCSLLWLYGFDQVTSNEITLIENNLPRQYFYRPDGFKITYFTLNVFTFKGLIGCFHLMFTIAVIVSSECYIYYRISKQLKINSNIMTLKTKQMHAQLNLVMIFNAVTALLSCLIPCGTILLCAMLEINLDGYGNYAYLFFICVSLFNPIASIIFIKPIYRELIAIVSCRKMKTNVKVMTGTQK
uniref:G_PROTEIN_RECEP_F1_2 domain-containing protein n=1 Tax=Rhabditophanes sp. KR3021 TaxID=114890 RepID=A0AC35THR3_9BILA